MSDRHERDSSGGPNARPLGTVRGTMTGLARARTVVTLLSMCCLVLSLSLAYPVAGETPHYSIQDGPLAVDGGTDRGDPRGTAPGRRLSTTVGQHEAYLTGSMRAAMFESNLSSADRASGRDQLLLRFADRLDQRLAALQHERNRTVRQYRAGEIDEDTYRYRMSRVRARARVLTSLATSARQEAETRGTAARLRQSVEASDALAHNASHQLDPSSGTSSDGLLVGSGGDELTTATESGTGASDDGGGETDDDRETGTSTPTRTPTPTERAQTAAPTPDSNTSRTETDDRSQRDAWSDRPWRPDENRSDDHGRWDDDESEGDGGPWDDERPSDSSPEPPGEGGPDSDDGRDDHEDDRDDRSRERPDEDDGSWFDEDEDGEDHDDSEPTGPWLDGEDGRGDDAGAGPPNGSPRSDETPTSPGRPEESPDADDAENESDDPDDDTDWNWSADPGADQGADHPTDTEDHGWTGDESDGDSPAERDERAEGPTWGVDPDSESGDEDAEQNESTEDGGWSDADREWVFEQGEDEDGAGEAGRPGADEGTDRGTGDREGHPGFEHAHDESTPRSSGNGHAETAQ